MTPPTSRGFGHTKVELLRLQGQVGSILPAGSGYGLFRRWAMTAHPCEASTFCQPASGKRPTTSRSFLLPNHCRDAATNPVIAGAVNDRCRCVFHLAADPATAHLLPCHLTTLAYASVGRTRQTNRRRGVRTLSARHRLGPGVPVLAETNWRSCRLFLPTRNRQ